MKKMLLVLAFITSINAMAATRQNAQPIGTFPRIPWEPVGISKDGVYGNRIDKLSTPTGWIVKIITLKNNVSDPTDPSNKPSVMYMYIPDAQHQWGKGWADYQALLDAAGVQSLVDKPR
jgi:hypothetical protein